MWSPLVDHTAEQRDALIRRAGWEPLLHRSRECRCVLGNAGDIATWTEEDVEDIEALETKAAEKCDPPNSLMFDPAKKAGRPKGIREVVKWAKAVVKDRAEEPSGGCDSGYCTG